MSDRRFSRLAQEIRSSYADLLDGERTAGIPPHRRIALAQGTQPDRQGALERRIERAIRHLRSAQQPPRRRA